MMNAKSNGSTAAWLLILLVCGASFASRGSIDEPGSFFRQYIGLNDEQVSSIQHGQAIAKILDSPTADQVFVFGAIFVKAAPESYLKLAADLDRLRKLPSYLAIREFSDPPVLSDLDDFTLEQEDIKQLKDCRPGKCAVQLPAEVMEEFQKSVDWSSPNAAEMANHVARQIALRALQEYIRGGNEALGSYRDKKHPTEVAETFRALLNRSKALPAYLPELDRYLLDYPKAKVENAESQFYWEKVNFGLKPTLRMVQAIVYRGAGPAEPAYAVAIKQLYSSHYFETALDLTVCVTDQGMPHRDGFYLITLKGSQQAGLTGFTGGIVRKVAVDKTRSSMEKLLETIKGQLENEAK